MKINEDVRHKYCAVCAGFYPIFRVFDDTLFQSWVFEGNYTLKVIGGSPEFETIRNYTQEEIFAYNNKHG